MLDKISRIELIRNGRIWPFTGPRPYLVFIMISNWLKPWIKNKCQTLNTINGNLNISIGYARMESACVIF